MEVTMRRICFIWACLLFVWNSAPMNGQTENGEMDAVTDFASKQTVSIPMPDGVQLSTDVYLPVFTDSLIVPFNIQGFGQIQISLLEKGSQYIIYDSINGQPNPNPNELPTLFIRTPYNKNTENLGQLLAFLGYSVVIQDNRGTYASGGNYLPMFSDSWPKYPYHPNFVHVLDQFEAGDDRNANHHSDGVNSLHYIVNKLKRNYLGDSIKISNGSVGMIGASALGNVQYQLAAAEKIDPAQPGVKALMPIVAANEHYKSTAVENGVFRQALVTNWITRQYIDVLDDENPEAPHSSLDFNLSNTQEVAQKAIEYWMTEKNGEGPAGYYPNSPIRAELDASFAPVDENGVGNPNGQYSRYSNMEVPMYHLTGWWDIFIDGQIETFNQVRQHLNPEGENVQMQKLVIGPWAHQTIAEQVTGDVAYPENVRDFLIDLDQFGNNQGNFQLSDLLRSEMFSWFRTHLNRNSFKNVGEPKVLIKASTKWQNIASSLQLQIPSKDYIIPYHQFINFIGGKARLEDFPYKIKQLGFELENTLDFEPLNNTALALDEPIKSNSLVDVKNLPAVRLYIAAAEQNKAGNYWFETDSFPFKKGIVNQDIYLNQDGSLQVENHWEAGNQAFIHDPDHPVFTVGGANMTIKLPEREQHSQGQINLADAQNAAYTMNRPDVLQFTSPPLADSAIVLGYPTVSLFASSMPQNQFTDSTNTDFFVRILEVLPTGEELFVVDGAINARARNYAAQIALGDENENIPFSNIVSGETYRYHFRCLPIGYAFQKGSRIKVLVSSSNYPRFQSNPNVPLNQGEFFLRKPFEDITYMYNGQPLKARKARQTIFMGGEFPTKISLPVYQGNLRFDENTTPIAPALANVVQVFPNPATTEISILNTLNNAKLEVFTLSGSKVFEQQIHSNAVVNVSQWPSGIYVLKLTDSKENRSFLKKIVVQ